MAVFTGPWRRSWLTGFFWRTLCFTGWHAWLFRAWLIGFGALEGAVIGFLIGVITSIIGIAATAELGPLTVISLAIGAAFTVEATKVGAVIGGIAGALIAAASNCPNCGLCFEMAFYLLLGRRMVPVIPFLILPRPQDCTTVIPPGCPP